MVLKQKTCIFSLGIKKLKGPTREEKWNQDYDIDKEELNNIYVRAEVTTNNIRIL